MALFKKSEFEKLAKKRSRFSISIYVPTHRSGENADSKIRFKNQLSDVEKTLEKEGLKPREIEHYTQPMRDLEKDFDFWQHLSDALIIFRNEELFQSITLPLEVEPFSLVSDQFYMVPLLSIFNSNDKFWLFTLSQNDNQLFMASQHEIIPMETKGVLPDNIKDSVGYDVEQKSLQYRSGQTQSGAGMYHGQGEGKDDKDSEVLKYLYEVNQGLNELLSGYDIPLVVASVDELFATFKDIADYKNVYPENVSGNYENDQITLVHEKAKEILEPYFNAIREKMKDRYHESKDKKTNDIEKIVTASADGSVDTLFVSKNETLWGEFDEEKRLVVIHKSKAPTDNCLIDIAAKNTFLNGGKVFREEPEQLPEKQTTVNALLRF